MADLKWAMVGDLQCPYQDDRAVALWFQVMKWFKPDVIDLIGDIDDQLEYSKYSDGTTDEFFNKIKKSADDESPMPYIAENARVAREFYQKVRKTFPNAEIFAALGNHDIRIFDYIDRKAPAWIDQVTPEFLWDFNNLGIEYIYYSDRPKHRFGDIHVHHGNAISQHAGESVRKDVEAFGVSLVRGHSHRAGTYFKTYPMRNETVRGYEMGHMCDEASYGMRYTNNPAWQKGFGIAFIDGATGHPHIQFIEITQDYTCVVNGKKFQG